MYTLSLKLCHYVFTWCHIQIVPSCLESIHDHSCHFYFTLDSFPCTKRTLCLSIVYSRRSVDARNALFHLKLDLACFMVLSFVCLYGGSTPWELILNSEDALPLLTFVLALWLIYNLLLLFVFDHLWYHSRRLILFVVFLHETNNHLHWQHIDQLLV